MARSSARRSSGGGRIITPGSVRRGSPVQFFQETISELRKAVWPTREETVRLSWYVIVLAGVIMAFLSGMDEFFDLTFRPYVLGLR